MYFLVATKYFYVATELAMVERLYVAIELFYVMTECGQRKRFGFATGNFMLQHSLPSWGDFYRDKVG